MPNPTNSILYGTSGQSGSLENPDNGFTISENDEGNQYTWANQQVAFNGSDQELSALINNDNNTSQLQQFSGSGIANYLIQLTSDYTGANLTGIEHDAIATYNTAISIYATGSSIETLLAGLASGVSNLELYFSGGNGTGTNYQTNTNYNAGNSQVEFYQPTSEIATEFYNATGLNGVGTNTSSIFNWTAGGSEGVNFVGLPNGINKEDANWTGVNLSGTQNNEIYDYTTPVSIYKSNSSIESVMSNLATGVAGIYKYYSQDDATGLNYQTNTNYTAGNSQVWFNAPSASVISETYNASGLNGAGSDLSNVLDMTNGTSQDQIFANLASGISAIYKNFAAENDTGALTTEVIDATAGTTIGSTGANSIDIKYFSTGVYWETFMSGATSLGYVIADASVAIASAVNLIQDAGFGADDGSGNGSDSGTDNASNLGSYDDTSTDTSEAEFTSASFVTSNLAATAPYVVANGDASATLAAELGAAAAYADENYSSTGATNAPSYAFAGAKWASNSITWSFATSAGTAASPFSSYITNTQYQTLVKEAFAAWASASGLTLTQVADSTSSDIRVGFGDLSTAASGLAGYPF